MFGKIWLISLADARRKWALPAISRALACFMASDVIPTRQASPRRNRVTPFSDLIADPARGLYMGNRGCLHDADGQIRRPWRGALWICCVTKFKDRRRTLMKPGCYTELFFLDEAVALAAGHRPCAECRRADYLVFRAAWDRAGLPVAARAADMDRTLHQARLDPETRQQARLVQPVASLPDGAFIADGRQAYLVLGDRLLVWRPEGYGPAKPRPQGSAEVLTPAPILAVLAAGYRPQVHPTAA